MNILQLLDTAPEPPIIDWQQFNLDYDTLSGDFKLATPLADFQKELTDQIVSLHYSDILKFFERVKDEDDTSESNGFTPQEQLIVDSLETLLMNSQLVCTHPYLLIDHYFPKSLTAKDVPKRIEESSGKFKVLKQLLDVIERISAQNGTSYNVVIIARPGKTIDLVDAFLLGARCSVKRHSGTKLKDTNGSKSKAKQQESIQVHLLPSATDELEQLKGEIFDSKVDLVISFDISCNTDCEVIRRLRKQHQTSVAPILRLVPINTIEHIALYYRDLVSSRNYSEYLKPVTAALVVMRDRAGTLTSALRPIYAKNLEYLEPWLRSLKTDQVARWMLPDLATIPYFHTRDVEKSLLTEVKYQFDDEFEHPTSKLELPGFEQTSLENSLEEAAAKNKPEDQLLESLPTRIKQILRQKTDYYEKKRLKREYLSNPLATVNYSDVTGIAKPQQGLHNEEVLTHKLMQGLTARYSELALVNAELRTFDNIYETRQADKEVVLKALSGIINDVDHVQTRISISEKKIAKREQEIAEMKPRIQALQAEIDAYVAEEREGNAKQYVVNEVKLHDLHEKLESLRSRLESQQNEVEYTSKEAGKASEAIETSKKELEKLDAEIGELRVKADGMFDTPAIKEAETSASESKTRYETEQRRNVSLIAKLDELFKSLNETQMQRIRHGNSRTTARGSPMLR